MGVLRFDGVDDRVKWTTLAQALKDVSDGAWTLAIGVKRATDDANFHGLSYLLSSTGNGVIEAGCSLNGGDALVADGLASASTVTITGTTETYFVVASKAAGNSPVISSRYVKSTTTWTHANGGNLVDQIDATMLEIGAWQNGDFFNGWIPVVAWWEGSMSQANKEALVTNWRTSDLWNSAHGQPTFLTELNVAGASATDLAGNASAITVTGTTLDAAETFGSWTFDATGAGGTDFPLNADPGSYALTGTAAGALAARQIPAVPGSIALTGAAAAVPAGRAVTATPGAYSLAGNTAGLLADRNVPANPGAYAVTGADAITAAGWLFTASPGSYALTGATAELLYEQPGLFDLNADPGAYTLTGQIAAALATRLLTAAPGQHDLAGTDAGVLVGRGLACDVVAYTLTGQATSLLAVRAVIATPAEYTLTGVNLTTVWSGEDRPWTYNGDQAVSTYAGTATYSYAGTATWTYEPVTG